MFSQPLIESEQMYDDTKETLITMMMEVECSTDRINKDGDLYSPEHPPYDCIYVSSNDVRESPNGHLLLEDSDQLCPGYDDDDSIDKFMVEGTINNNNE